MPSVNFRNFRELAADCIDLNLTVEQHLNALRNAGFDIYIGSVFELPAKKPCSWV